MFSAHRAQRTTRFLNVTINPLSISIIKHCLVPVPASLMLYQEHLVCHVICLTHKESLSNSTSRLRTNASFQLCIISNQIQSRLTPIPKGFTYPIFTTMVVPLYKYPLACCNEKQWIDWLDSLTVIRHTSETNFCECCEWPWTIPLTTASPPETQHSP